MGWRTDVQSIVFEASDKIKNAKDNIKGLLKGITGGAKATFMSVVSGTSYVGINGQKIVYMRDGIRDYVKVIQDHLDKVVAEASTTNAFKGEYAGAVTEYVKEVEESCKAFTTALLQFSDNLDIIAEAYHAKDSELASSIKSSAKEASSQGDAAAYTEQRGDASYGNASRGSYGN